MASVIADRVQETTSTIGTGTLDLNGAVAGFRTVVAAIGDGASSYFVMTDGTDWEVFIGTVAAGAPDTLSRDAVLASSNNGARVSWPAGTKRVWLGVPAGKSLFLSPDGSMVENLPPAFHDPAVEEALGRLGVAPVSLRATELAGALALHLYDPAQDSDGGAWLERCAGTSWWREVATEGVFHGRLAAAPSSPAYAVDEGDLYYDTTAGAWKKYDGAAWNTTTRGCTRLPRGPWLIAALGSGSSLRVAIHDAGDPALPMWMIFTAGSVNMIERGNGTIAALHACNGLLAVARTSSQGLSLVDFVLDRGLHYYQASVQDNGKTIAERNAGTDTRVAVSATGMGAGETVQGVWIGARSGAPADPARLGLPRPTIAVATSTGRAIVKDDGSILAPSGAYSFTRAMFSPGVDDPLFNRSGAYLQWHMLDANVTGQAYAAAGGGNHPYLLSSTSLCLAPFGQGGFAAGSAAGLTLMPRHEPDEDIEATVHVTRTYSTGLMFGDFRAAWLADSDTADRSGHGNDLTPTGAVTSSPAMSSPASDLVGYSGWSGNVYRTIAADADFDVGANGFMLATWVRVNTLGSHQRLIEYGQASAANQRWHLSIEGSSGRPTFQLTDGPNFVTAQPSIDLFDNKWHQIVGVWDAATGTARLYLDGALAASGTNASVGSLTNGDAGRRVRIGIGVDDANQATTSVLALLRFGYATPGAAQVKLAHDWERALFRGGARAFLAGTADQVDALACDASTRRLYASGGDGTSVFRGLERVGYIDAASDPNLTDDDHDAVAAGAGLYAVSTAYETAVHRDPVPAGALLARGLGAPPSGPVPLGPEGFIQGGFVPKLRGMLRVAASMTLRPEHEGLVVSVETNASTITLPRGDRLRNGWTVTVRRGAANATLARAGSDAIYGRGFAAAASITLGEAGATLTVMNVNQGAWVVVADTIGPNALQTELVAGQVDPANDSMTIFDASDAKTRLVRPKNLGLGTEQGSAKGWVRFNGTGTLAVNDGFNATGVTDNGTGDYTIAWDTDFGNANYALAAMAGLGGAGQYSVAQVKETPLAGSVRIATVDQSGGAPALADKAVVAVAAFGDQ